ncbi:MFS transporter [Actinokineospora fastidiosa]|uniref:MFS transporter n=1 Tax=Actinokineospora fastidiosa TaxID=1816 RepID=A0A918LDL6_9PSEU|nr:MFS transporter [Actinokineospora fastidiosa]GGS32507.1 MFS transporter [Actinokineospora fastidiosa]
MTVITVEGDRLTGRARGALLVLCGALFLDALDVSMKGVALPSIGADLGMGPGALQWVVSAYVLGFGGFLLLGGRAADLFGRRRVFLVSLGFFTAASALGGFADDGPLLVAARLVTGISAAFTLPAGLSIITTSFAEGPARNKALALYTATGATGFSMGLVVGGVLTEVDWRWVFFAPVVMALLTLAAGIALVPVGEAPERTSRFDVLGAVTSTGALLALVLALVQAHEWGWATLIALGVSAALFTLFVVVEKRTAHPLVRLSLLRSPALMRANVGAMSLLGGWVSALFVLTLYMQDLRGWSALETGLAVLPGGVVTAVLAPRVAAPLVNRFGTTPVVAAGLFAAVAAYVLLLPIGLDSGYLAMLPAFLLAGFAFTLAYGPLNMAATQGVPAHEQGLAGGIVNTSFQVGPALALAAATVVLQLNAGDGSPAALLSGFRAALLVPLAVAVVGTAVTLLGLRARRS